MKIHKVIIAFCVTGIALFSHSFGTYASNMDYLVYQKDNVKIYANNNKVNINDVYLYPNENIDVRLNDIPDGIDSISMTMKPVYEHIDVETSRDLASAQFIHLNFNNLDLDSNFDISIRSVE